MRRGVIFFTVGLALILLSLRFYFYLSGSLVSDNSNIVFEGRLFSQVKTNRNYQSFSINYNGQKIFINLPLYPRLAYGDKVKIEGVTERKMLDRGEIWVMQGPKVEFLEEKFSILRPIYNFRAKVVKVYKSYLPPDEASLLLGIVFGIKESFSETFYEDLRKAGVLHVIAASGMNVSMLGALLG